MPALKGDQVKSVGNRSKFHKRKRKVLSFNLNKMIDAFCKNYQREDTCVLNNNLWQSLFLYNFWKNKNLLSVLDFTLILLTQTFDFKH